MTPPRKDQQQAEFERLFTRTRTDLLAYLLRRAAPEDAADLLSQTYLIAWNRIDAIPPDDQARPWLFGVARNLLLKKADQHRLGGQMTERLANELHTATSQQQPPLTPAQTTGIHQAIEILSERDREMLLLSAWDGLTPREIATVVGTSPNTVRVRLHRIRTRLRKHVRTHESPVSLLDDRDLSRMRKSNQPSTANAQLSHPACIRTTK